jgi:endonuclease YncB( thermonuclease family)
MRHAFAVLILLTGPALAAEPIVGRASVTDGDTVVIRGTRIRLHGIDAPESAPHC